MYCFYFSSQSDLFDSSTQRHYYYLLVLSCILLKGCNISDSDLTFVSKLKLTLTNKSIVCHIDGQSERASKIGGESPQSLICQKISQDQGLSSHQLQRFSQV